VIDVRSTAPRRVARRQWWRALALTVCLVGTTGLLTPAAAQNGGAAIPELTRPVNDFAGVVDAQSAQGIEQTIRALQAASGDVIVVATVPTYEPYGDIRDYAVRMFQNGGRGIGERGKDNGMLILVSLKERRVWVEVGYALEQFITDGFAGQVSREVMTPQFRGGAYGSGLLAGTNAFATRIAQGRNVQLTGVPQVAVRRRPQGPQLSANWIVLIIVILIIISRSSGGGGGPRGVRRWGQSGWSGWSSGVGPFGGGFGGGGGGFGGGFGGFGGGRSGGGGGGSSW